MTRMTSTVFRLVMFTVALILSGVASVSAQVMDLSSYNDAWSSENSGLLYGATDVIDNSSGCTHDSYVTDIWLYSPTRSTFDQAYGTSASASLTFEEETGEWSVSHNTSFSCSCTQAPLAFAGGSGFGVALRTTYFRSPVRTGPVSCFYPNTACASGTPTCAGGWAFALYSPTLGCPQYAGATFLLITFPDRQPLCSVGITWPAYGPGACD
jgi:hypothetical protein